MTFDQWSALVDQWVERLAGCSLLDLPDVPLRDWYEDETPAKTAARRAIREAQS